MKGLKVIGVLTLLTLSELIRGAWVSLAQPILLTLGFSMSLLDIDTAPINDVNFIGWFKRNEIH